MALHIPPNIFAEFALSYMSLGSLQESRMGGRSTGFHRLVCVMASLTLSNTCSVAWETVNGFAPGIFIVLTLCTHRPNAATSKQHGEWPHLVRGYIVGRS